MSGLLLLLAVIFAVPPETPVTTPFSSTVATDLLLLVQVRSVFGVSSGASVGVSSAVLLGSINGALTRTQVEAPISAAEHKKKQAKQAGIADLTRLRLLCMPSDRRMMSNSGLRFWIENAIINKNNNLVPHIAQYVVRVSGGAVRAAAFLRARCGRCRCGSCRCCCVRGGPRGAQCP